MKIEVAHKPISLIKSPALVVCLCSDGSPTSGVAAELDRMTSGLISDLYRSGEFSGEPGSLAVLHLQGAAVERIVLSGLGKRASVSTSELRAAVARAARRVRDLKRGEFTTLLPGILEAPQEARAVTEGILLGLYRFDRYKSASATKQTDLKRALIIPNAASDLAALGRIVSQSAIAAEYANACRDLVNTPAQDLTPMGLAATARKLCAGSGVRVTVWNRERLAKEHMGSLLSVAQGSAQPPCLIQMEHRPAGARGAPLVLVGKAVTFDTGGVDIKTRAGMETMKCDMAGGAAVIATLAACGKLKVPRPVIGIVPATENMPGGRAIKPGDVVRARNGKTIEILNTDAEGRLILADALVLASEKRPEAIIDLATLTGACVVALGDLASGMMTTYDDLAAKLIAAGESCGERVWRLPLWDEYLDHVKSKVADVKNVGKTGEAGAIAGAAFLKEFVKEDIPWAHLDIAGPAFIEEKRALHPFGATGWGVRLLLELMGHS